MKLTEIVNSIIQKINSLTSGKVDKIVSVDNTVPRFDGTSGQVQNSSVTIDDSGNVGMGTSTPRGIIDTTSFTVKNLPFFYFGASSINDEYLVISRAYDGEFINASGVAGRIVGSRGTTTAGNSLGVTDIVIQSAYNLNTVSKFNNHGSARFTQIDIISIDGVKYLALKGSASGGEYNNKFYFEGYINTNNTSLVLSRVRLSNANVELITSGFAYPSYPDNVKIDSLGNVGIGVTPSAWSLDGYLQLKQGRWITSQGSDIGLGSNCYYGSGWKYASNGFATGYVSESGTQKWLTAPSGTTGSDITWTNTMTLANNGNLLVGTTTDNGVDKLQVNGSISATNLQQGTFTPSFWDNSQDTVAYNNTIADSYGTWKKVGKEVEVTVRFSLGSPCQVNNSYMALRMNSPYSLAGTNYTQSSSTMTITAGAYPNYIVCSGNSTGIDEHYRGLTAVALGTSSLYNASNVIVVATFKFQKIIE